MREREFIFHIAKTLNKYTTEMQNQEGCQKGTWPIMDTTNVCNIWPVQRQMLKALLSNPQLFK